MGTTAGTREIVVNGEPRSIEADATVESFLRAHDLDPDAVVVECNREIVPRSAYGTTRLAPGDALEIVHFVGGG